MDAIARLEASIAALITEAESLNANDQPTRSRRLSLAITKLEEAKHWLHAITDEIPF